MIAEEWAEFSDLFDDDYDEEDYDSEEYDSEEYDSEDEDDEEDYDDEMEDLFNEYLKRNTTEDPENLDELEIAEGK